MWFCKFATFDTSVKPAVKDQMLQLVKLSLIGPQNIGHIFVLSRGCRSLTLLTEWREGFLFVFPSEIIVAHSIFKILLIDVHILHVYRGLLLELLLDILRLIQLLLHLLLRVELLLILADHHLAIHKHRIHLLGRLFREVFSGLILR